MLVVGLNNLNDYKIVHEIYIYIILSKFIIFIVKNYIPYCLKWLEITYTILL